MNSLATGDVLLAFALTLFAGLATGVGGLIAFTAKRTNTTLLCVALSFSAGVMIYVSFIEIFVKARAALAAEMAAQPAYALTTAAFFAGMVLIALIDKLVPQHENPHEMHKVEELHEKKPAAALYRMGILTALAISIHNFPEGLATFTAALQDPNLGISIAMAIAVHNIPEGIAVAIPVYYATGSRGKALAFSALSGLAEPIGALIGYLVLLPFFSGIVFGLLFAAVGGIMVFISFDQILPAARAYGHHHASVYALLAGMMVMAASLILFIP